MWRAFRVLWACCGPSRVLLGVRARKEGESVVQKSIPRPGPLVAVQAGDVGFGLSGNCKFYIVFIFVFFVYIAVLIYEDLAGMLDVEVFFSPYEEDGLKLGGKAVYLMTMSNSRINVLDETLYCVDGKLICCQPGIIDLSDQEGIDGLLEFAEGIFVKGSTVHPVYGKASICMIWEGGDGRGLIMSVGNIDGLEPRLRGPARKAVGLDA